MIARSDLKRLARAKFKDAEALFQNRRYDSASYLCGYVIELALKARICRTLKWDKFPETRKEFEGYQTFRTHNLEVLLHLSAYDSLIRTNYSLPWFVVATWSPEDRYKPIGSVDRTKASLMLDSVKILMEAL